MKKSLELMLSSSNIEETLNSLIKEKSSYMSKSLADLEKMYEVLLSKNLDKDEQSGWELIIHYLLGGTDIEQLEAELKRLNYYKGQVTTLTESKKLNPNSWDQIYQRVQGADIVEVISRYVPINSTSKNIRCPIHNDRTPSFKIYESNNSWYCFGCNKGGTPIYFIMEYHQVDFKEATKLLLNI